MKVYSIWKPSPEPTGQVFTQPSLTDVLADEPLERIYKRFVMSGQVPHMVDGDVDYSASDSDIEKAFADSATDDVSALDKVDRADILATAERLVEQLRFNSVKATEETPKTSSKAEQSQSEPGTGEKKENA